MGNPFVLTFGKRPLENIDRLVAKEEILDGFTSEEINQQIYIITGVRGSGKTVLMSEIAQELKSLSDWDVVELNPEMDLLEGLAAKMTNDSRMSQIFSSAKLNLSAFGIGLEIGKQSIKPDFESAIAKMLAAMKRHGRRLLVTIDEATNTPQMRVFASAFQILIRQDLPIFLLMTGLYENIDNLQNEKSLTFLFRAPKIQLKPLNLRAIANKYQEIFNLSDSDAKDMAQATRGYPYAFQILGYHTYRNGGDFRSAINLYRQYLDEYSYDKIWSEMSPKDKQVAYGIATAESARIIDIRNRIGMDTNEFNPYRKRLIRKGLIDGEERGLVRFILPFFEDYVVENFQ